MLAYLPLVIFAAILAGMFYQMRRAEEQRRERGEVRERSTAAILLTMVLVAFAGSVIAWRLAQSDSSGDAAIGSLPLLIFAVISVIYFATRGQSR